MAETVALADVEPDTVGEGVAEGDVLGDPEVDPLRVADRLAAGEELTVAVGLPERVVVGEGELLRLEVAEADRDKLEVGLSDAVADIEAIALALPDTDAEAVPGADGVARVLNDGNADGDEEAEPLGESVLDGVPDGETVKVLVVVMLRVAVTDLETLIDVVGLGEAVAVSVFEDDGVVDGVNTADRVEVGDAVAVGVDKGERVEVGVPVGDLELVVVNDESGDAELDDVGGLTLIVAVTVAVIVAVLLAETVEDRVEEIEPVPETVPDEVFDEVTLALADAVVVGERVPVFDGVAVAEDETVTMPEGVGRGVAVPVTEGTELTEAVTEALGLFETEAERDTVPVEDPLGVEVPLVLEEPDTVGRGDGELCILCDQRVMQVRDEMAAW